MKIFLTGGTGFIGGHLAAALTDNGHTVTVLSRRSQASDNPAVSFITGDPVQPGPWQEAVAGHQAVVNLAGRSIFCRWTEKNKADIRASRIATTDNLVAAMQKAGDRAPRVLISASAVGYYGDRADDELTETAPVGHDFLGRLVADWEAAAHRAEDHGIRVVYTRFGVVLGDGGALARMLPSFRYGLGSALGSGRQWFPWVHITDCCRIILTALEDERLSGPVNCVAPQAVRQRQFCRRLAAVLGRPFFLPAVPAGLLRLVLGEMASVLLASQRAVPARLQEIGFRFRFPTVDEALKDLIGSF